MSWRELYVFLFLVTVIRGSKSFHDLWLKVGCDEYLKPDNCNFKKIVLPTLDDFDRCGPARLTPNVRNFFTGVAGRGETYKENFNAFERIHIQPKMLRGSSDYSLKTTILGEEVDIPIGFSPTGLHKLASPGGEISTVEALSTNHTVMILNCWSSTLIEDVAKANENGKAILWLQIYFYDNRSMTLDLVRRAENNGFKAIVVTLDSPVDSTITCNAKDVLVLPDGVDAVNVEGGWFGASFSKSTSLTFQDLGWLASQTRLPIIAKGILKPQDAVRAVEVGAAGIFVSNQGGRNIDTEISTIDALPSIVEAVSQFDPRPEMYLDSGVRTGADVYKALARGANMVFLGRPVIWGLAINEEIKEIIRCLTFKGSQGVQNMLNIITEDFNKTMILAGSNKPSEIMIDTLIPHVPDFT